MVLPAAATVLVIAVLVDTLRDASRLSAAQWAGATAGILVGAFIAYLTALRSRIVFDAKLGEVRWHHSGWPGQGRGRCPLSDLVSVQPLGDSSVGGAQGLALLTSQGRIPLTRHVLSVERSHEETAASIRKWLSLHGQSLSNHSLARVQPRSV